MSFPQVPVRVMLQACLVLVVLLLMTAHGRTSSHFLLHFFNSFFRAKDKMAPKLIEGLICTYVACDLDKRLVGCKAKSECLCITRQICCAYGEEPIGCGLVTDSNNNECCKIGLYCCAYGCKTPEKLCAMACHTCSVKQVGSLPMDEDYVDQCVCAYYCLTCAPTLGCVQDAPPCPALERSVFDFRDREAPYMEKMNRMVNGTQMESYRDDDATGDIPLAEATLVDEGGFLDEY